MRWNMRTINWRKPLLRAKWWTAVVPLFHNDGIHLNVAGSNILVKMIDQDVRIIRGASTQHNRRPDFDQRNRKSNVLHFRENTGFNRNAPTYRDAWRYQRPPQRHQRFNEEDGRGSRFLSSGTGSSSWNSHYDRGTYFLNRRERQGYDDALSHDRRHSWNTNHPGSGSVYDQ